MESVQPKKREARRERVKEIRNPNFEAKFRIKDSPLVFLSGPAGKEEAYRSTIDFFSRVEFVLPFPVADKFPLHGNDDILS